MKKMSKIEVILFVLFVLFVVWIIASWVNVAFNNSNATGDYNNLNFFYLLLKLNRMICQ